MDTPGAGYSIWSELLRLLLRPCALPTVGIFSMEKCVRRDELCCSARALLRFVAVMESFYESRVSFFCCALPCLVLPETFASLTSSLLPRGVYSWSWMGKSASPDYRTRLPLGALGSERCCSFWE